MKEFLKALGYWCFHISSFSTGYRWDFFNSLNGFKENHPVPWTDLDEIPF